MLDCELRPGVGLGPFQIGASLWTVLSNLREQKHIFPSVQIKYDPTPPSSSTSPSVPVGGATSIVLVHLYPHFDLLFSPVGQRLHAISLRRLRHGVFPSLAPASVSVPHAGPGLCLRYKDHILSSPDITLKRSGVNKAFGPTYDWDSMKYPGVSFIFDEDPLTAVGMGTARGGEGDKNAEVKRVIVSEKFPDGHEADPFGEVLEGQILWGSISKAVIKVHQGVTLYFYPGESNALQVLIGTTTAQDLQVDLGPPIRVHYKEDDRMTIHATNQLEENKTQDYFMNYFQHGLDFLIDGDAHTVKKILLHTNALGSPAFQRYKRCPWVIETDTGGADQGQGRVFFYDHVDKISSFLDPSGEAPPSMNVDRADDDVLSLPSSYTRLCGFDGIILEATDTGVVSAVTLY